MMSDLKLAKDKGEDELKCLQNKHNDRFIHTPSW